MYSVKNESFYLGDVVEGDLIVDNRLIHLMKGLPEGKREFYSGNSQWSKFGNKVKIPYTINGLGKSHMYDTGPAEGVTRVFLDIINCRILFHFITFLHF